MIRLQDENLEAHQAEIMRLVEEATAIDAVDVTRPEAAVLADWMQKAQFRNLNRKELWDFTRAVQAAVMLPVYTTRLAAAWIGVSEDAIGYAIWRADPPLLDSFKPGHDTLIPHASLVRYHQKRRGHERV